jgi:hypothetical protein
MYGIIIKQERTDLTFRIPTKKCAKHIVFYENGFYYWISKLLRIFIKEINHKTENKYLQANLSLWTQQNFMKNDNFICALDVEERTAFS